MFQPSFFLRSKCPLKGVENHSDWCRVTTINAVHIAQAGYIGYGKNIFVKYFRCHLFSRIKTHKNKCYPPPLHHFCLKSLRILIDHESYF